MCYIKSYYASVNKLDYGVERQDITPVTLRCLPIIKR